MTSTPYPVMQGLLDFFRQCEALEEQFERSLVLEEAETWVGTPYHDRADKKGVGVDCVMLLVSIFNATKVADIQDPRPYPKDWFLHKGGFERFLHGVLGYASPTEEYSPGNVVLWQVGRAMAHGGIIVEWPVVIHANPNYGFVVKERAERCYIGKAKHLVFNPWGVRQ